MNFSIRRSPERETVGIDIDGRYLAAAQTRDGRVVRAISTDLPEGILKDGEVVDRAGLSEALSDFASRYELPRHVRLGISNQQIVVRVVDLPRIDDEAERTSALQYQASETIAMPLDEAVLDHQIAGYVRGSGGERMQVVLVAARRTMIDEFVAAVRDAGLKPDGIDLDAFALVRMLAHAPSADEPMEPESARVYCHLGGVTNLAVAVGRSCFFTRALSATPDRDGFAARLSDEIRLSLDYYRTQPGARTVGEVVLSGPGVDDEALTSEVAGHLGIPVAAANPLGALDVGQVMHNDELYRYTIAAGLALGADE